MPRPAPAPASSSESDEGDEEGSDPDEDHGHGGGAAHGAVQRGAGKPAGRRALDEDEHSGSSDDGAGDDPTDSEDGEFSDFEHFTAAERVPAGDSVEQVEPPLCIRELYTFLELVYDSGEGRRVYMCQVPDDEAREPNRRRSSAGASRRRGAMHGVLQTDEVEDKKDHREKKIVLKRQKMILESLGTRRRCIVKVWQKTARSPSETRTWLDMQLRLLRMERHPNVMQPKKIREDERAYYVEFEAVQMGTSVLEMLVNDASTTEHQAQRMIKGILRGLGHLHKHGLAHRDVKPENILLEYGNMSAVLARSARPPRGWVSTKKGVRRWRYKKIFKTAWDRHDTRTFVRIIDLDTVSGPEAKTICGTPGYMAPEAYLGNAGPQGDLFSLGVILYLYIGCDSPLHDAVYDVLGGERLEAVPRQTRQRLAGRIADIVREIDWEAPPWDELPMMALFCRMLLQADPVTRGADANDVLSTAPWLRRAPASGIEADLSHMRNIESLDFDEADEAPPESSAQLRRPGGRRGGVFAAPAAPPQPDEDE